MGHSLVCSWKPKAKEDKRKETNQPDHCGIYAKFFRILWKGRESARPVFLEVERCIQNVVLGKIQNSP